MYISLRHGQLFVNKQLGKWDDMPFSPVWRTRNEDKMCQFDWIDLMWCDVTWQCEKRIQTINSPQYRHWSWWVVLLVDNDIGLVGSCPIGIMVLVGKSWALLLFFPIGNCPQWGVVLEPAKRCDFTFLICTWPLRNKTDYVYATRGLTAYRSTPLWHQDLNHELPILRVQAPIH